MNFLEKDLEQIIFEADKEELAKRGLKIKGKLFRQLRVGNYGIVDLVEIERESAIIHEGEFIHPSKLHITIYELKKEKINVSAFLQAIGYLKGIVRYLEKKDIEVVPRIVLIGKTIDESSNFCYLEEFLKNVEYEDFLFMHTYSYCTDGIKFDSKYGYKLTNEGF